MSSRFEMKTLLPAVLVGVLIFAYINVGLKPVTQADFTSNLQSVAKDIADLKQGHATLQTQVAAANGLSGRMDQTDKSIASFSSTISSMQQKDGTLQANIDGFNSQVSALNRTIASLQQTVDAQKQTIDAQAKTIADHETRLKKLETAAVVAATPPTLTSFSPSSGAAGTSVVITGTNFVTGATSVTFGGTAAASVVVNSATQITATVGTGTSGTIAVVTSAGTTTSTTAFTVTGSTTPTPASGLAVVVQTPTVTVSSTSNNTISINLQNNTGKAIYSEQIALKLTFVSVTNLNTWGLVITVDGVVPNPTPQASYSVIPGVVNYNLDIPKYLIAGGSTSVNIGIAIPSGSASPVTVLADASVNGFSAY